MNLEKLKPWNWFKHEDNSANQVPILKSNTSGTSVPQMNQQLPVSSSPAGSFLQLHQEMDRLFDNVWRSFGLPSSPGIIGTYGAKLDVSGGDKEYEVSIELPGLSEDDIHIDLQGNVLTIRGEKEQVNEDKDKHYYRIERSSGSFQRTLSLPDDADAANISATLKDGLLTLSIPRRETQKENVKRIPISS